MRCIGQDNEMNPEQLEDRRLYARRYYWKNREKIRQWGRDWQERNREKTRESTRRNRRENPEKVKKCCRDHLMRKYYIRREWCIDHMGGQCEWCGSRARTKLVFSFVGPGERSKSTIATLSEQDLVEELKRYLLLCKACDRIHQFKKLEERFDGVRCPSAKLTADQVAEIKRSLVERERCEKIAERYGVLVQTINGIRYLSYYTHIVSELNPFICSTEYPLESRFVEESGEIIERAQKMLALKEEVSSPKMAHILGVGVDTVKRLSDKGRIPHNRPTPDSHRRFNIVDVLASFGLEV